MWLYNKREYEYVLKRMYSYRTPFCWTVPFVVPVVELVVIMVVGRGVYQTAHYVSLWKNTENKIWRGHGAIFKIPTQLNLGIVS